jgi:pimeloyl-ACP methyl ester carboxylesterase
MGRPSSANRWEAPSERLSPKSQATTSAGWWSSTRLRKNASPRGLGFTAELSTAPVIGPALWRVTPDSAIKDGLKVAFAPGYEVPDEFVDEFNRMTYTSYDSDGEEGDYMDAKPLDRRIERTGTPLLAIFGAEDQLYESEAALAAYAKVPGAQTILIPGAGHSPNIEKPGRTAALVLRFAQP